MRLVTLPGVFCPRSDSLLLADAVREEPLGPAARTLDVFTGSGIAAVAAALAGHDAHAVDLSRRAALTAALNARLNGVRVRVRRGDLFEPVAGDAFDLVSANPPYVPGDAELPRHGAARAWEGGEDGRALLDRLIAEAPRVLRPGGTLLLVHSEVCGEEQTLRDLRRHGLDAGVVRRERGPLGPLVRARAPELERRGLLEPGQREEDVFVIAGRRTATA